MPDRTDDEKRIRLLWVALACGLLSIVTAIAALVTKS